VEILTAVAIIAILVSMAFLGFKYASAGPKQKLTETTLHNVRGMLSEYEAQGGRMKDLLAAYTDNTDPTAPKPRPGPVTFEVLDQDNLQTYNIVPPPMPPSAGYGAKYYDIYATAYQIMPRLRAVPANKAVLDALPTDHVYPKAWTATKEPGKKAPYIAADMRSYQPNERVQSGNGFYICVAPLPGYTVSESSPQPPELDTTHWKQDAPNFLVLDAWGSPIIFVPPAGAVEMYEGGAISGDPANPVPPDSTAYKHVASPSGAKQVPPKQAPDRKGYFMSAGPDKNFAGGDDNIYSFENK
jgi:type II secretory pathway pseudopilin PulG